MKFLVSLLLILFAFGCQQATPEEVVDNQPADDVAIVAEKGYAYTFSEDHFGKIKSGMTLEQVTEAYGTDNFVAGTLYGPEGITYPGYRLFPGTDAEAEVTFPEADEQDDLGISIKIFKPGSPWRAADSGIGVGSSLAELVRLNDRVINFYGFGWDYGGLVSNFNGGNLSENYRFILHLDYGTVSDEDASVLSGDQEIDSNFPQLKEADVSVRAVFLEL